MAQREWYEKRGFEKMLKEIIIDELKEYIIDEEDYEILETPEEINVETL